MHVDSGHLFRILFGQKKNQYMENVRTLPEAVLGIISGGQLLEDQTENIGYVVHVLRDDSGMSPAEAKQLFIMDYHRVPHLYSTTGSEEDLQEFLTRLEAAWYSK